MGLRQHAIKRKILREIWIMLFIILGFIVLVFGGGFLWWIISQIITRPAEILTTKFPTYYEATEIAFTNAIVTYMLLFVIIGAFIWLITSAQRTSPEGHFR